ncbi:MAG: ribbon-helix-helix domain-containing protein [Thermoleophilia bacterium]|nr:ribbon-helix-helix domain-containing protein [Thermoleophilia bacterium]MDH5333950.1 ribbon-helix-helix domain-containing protein [Thermoleophilia bacterium]
MSHQLVTRVGDDLVAHVDRLVEAGILESRSQAVRLGLERLVDQLERRRIGEQIVEGYRRVPQTEDELDWVDAATERMIAEEPW